MTLFNESNNFSGTRTTQNKVEIKKMVSESIAVANFHLTAISVECRISGRTCLRRQ